MNETNKPHILIVDDCAVNQAVLAKFMEKLDVPYRCAFDGLEAVGLAKKNNFDIIFMDCHMPIYNGYTTTAEIRLGEYGQTTKIYALTSDATQHNRNMCELCGMDAFILKPVIFESVKAIVNGSFYDYFLSSPHHKSMVSD